MYNVQYYVFINVLLENMEEYFALIKDCPQEHREGTADFRCYIYF